MMMVGHRRGRRERERRARKRNVLLLEELFGAGHVGADDLLLTSEPASVLPLAQRYFLF